MNISVCGIDCDRCNFFKEKKCLSCRIAASNGKCVWGGRCDTHDCAINQNLNHCGYCTNFPCEQLLNIHKSENPDGNGIEIKTLNKLVSEGK